MAFQTGGSGGSSTLAGDTDVSIVSPADGQALIHNGAVWTNKKPWVLQLDYALASDVSSLTISTSVWTDIIANQSFTVDDANSLVQLSLRSMAFATTSSSTAALGIRINVDSGGTPVTKLLGGTYIGSAATNIVVPISGSVFLTGLSATAHTVKMQGKAANITANFFCRPSSSPDQEHLEIQVVEWK